MKKIKLINNLNGEIVIDSIHNAVIENDGVATYIRCSCFGKPMCEIKIFACQVPKAIYKKCKKYIITAKEINE